MDGPGIRMVVFCQGCPHLCPGCHNPETHDQTAGSWQDTADLLAQFQSQPLLSGLTLSGGEPLLQAAACAELASGVKNLHKQVLLYTGYTWEELTERGSREADVAQLLQNLDIMVDGRFELAQRDISLPFRGSANQRLIDVTASRCLGRAQELKLAW